MERDADKPVVVEGRPDHVVEVENVLDEHVEYVHQQVGLDYLIILVEGDADKPVV